MVRKRAEALRPILVEFECCVSRQTRTGRFWQPDRWGDVTRSIVPGPNIVLTLGEDIDARLPQGKIRGYQNLNTKPSYVIEKCLWDLFEAVKRQRPGCTERDLRDHINWFLTHEEGYIDRRIAKIAKASKGGKVIPDDL